MEGWSKLQASIGGIAGGISTDKFVKSFNSSYQATRERLGQIPVEDITELPKEYVALEERVDALRATHLAVLKITKVYTTETYDYPTQINESIAELSANVAHGVTSFAAANLKGTNIPTPPVTAAPEVPHKTLPHALSRVALGGAQSLGTDLKLGKALEVYGTAQDKIGKARLEQDAAISERFVAQWQSNLSSSIAVALKARAAVRVSRLELDAAKQTLKTAAPPKQEQARLQVENCEDDLVQKTEVAITLMKTVLDNPEPLKNLNELIQAQLVFYAAAAEVLSNAQGEVEELSVAAEGEYRKSRDH